MNPLQPDKKYLVIIAGPNGAGKSFSSKTILKSLGLSISSFDWDKTFYSLWRDYGYDPAVESGIRDKANSAFNGHIETCFECQSDISYETNFHHEYNLNLIKRAKERGYHVVLIFLYLENISIASKRVKTRVLMGGHDVDDQTINERFEKGLAMLNRTVLLVDSLAIYDHSIDYEPSLLFTHSYGKLNVQRKIPIDLYRRLKVLAKIGIAESMTES